MKRPDPADDPTQVPWHAWRDPAIRVLVMEAVMARRLADRTRRVADIRRRVVVPLSAMQAVP